MNQPLRTIASRISKFLWTLFINGLITVLPLLLTIAIFNILFKFVKSLLEPVKNLIMSSAQFIPSWLQWIPHIEVIIAVICILMLGTVLNIFVFTSILSSLERPVQQNSTRKPYLFRHEATRKGIWSSGKKWI